MPKKSSSKNIEKVVSTLDPIFPLPANTGLPYLKDGEGADILNTELPFRTVELPYRAFWIMWEACEALAKRNYPKYVGGAMDNVAQASLEAVTAFRSAYARTELEPLSESKAQKIRSAELKPKKNDSTAEPTCRECSAKNPKKITSKKNGKKMFKCISCGHKWARGEVATAESQPRKGSGAPLAAEKPKKTSKKKKKK